MKSWPPYSKDFVESVFKWLAFNSVIAVFIQFSSKQFEEGKTVALIPTAVLTVFLFDMSNYYAISQIVDPILNRFGWSRESRGIKLIIIMLTFLCLQVTLWEMFKAFD